MNDLHASSASTSEPSPVPPPQPELARHLSEAGQNIDRARRREPIAGYLALAGMFLGATSAALHWLSKGQRRFPTPSPLDVALLSLGTARLSRLVTRDKVMLPLRAPFTATDGGPGARHEHAAGSGWVRAVGELVTCPRCAAMWSASALSLTYFASPSSARFAGLVLSSSLLSDLTNRCLALLDQVGTAPAATGEH